MTSAPGSGDLAEEQRKEIESLANALSIARNKFLTEFNESAELADAVELEHDNKNADYKSQLDRLNECLLELHDKELDAQRAKEGVEKMMKKLEEASARLKAETDEFLRGRETTSARVTQMEENNAKQKGVLATQERSMAQTTVELEKSMELFSGQLGLSLKKISGGRLQVIFSNLDAKDPAQVCFFCVKISADRTYDVTDCEPSVPELPRLIQKLNTTNNFRSFIVALRKEFKQAL